MINDLVKRYRASLQASETNKHYLVNADEHTKKIIVEKITREKIILESLEKQVPKKAEYHHKVNGECALTICPNCENRVIVTRFAFPLDRYCKECGQHYVIDIKDWDIEE